MSMCGVSMCSGGSRNFERGVQQVVWHIRGAQICEVANNPHEARK